MRASFASALVTGGAGFIGSHIVDALVQAGVRTTVLDDLSSGTTDHLPRGVRMIEADVAEPGTVGRITDVRADLVVHAAAQVSVPASVADVARDRAVNLVGTEHVLEGSRRGGASRVVFLSSGGAVYGEANGADEETSPRPASPYGIHKLAAEGSVRTSGLSWAILRPSNVYGPRQRAGLEGGVVAVFAEALQTGSPITVHGDGRQTRDLVHVADVTRAVLLAGSSAKAATWNVSTGVGTSILDLLAMMEALAGRSSVVEHGPARSGDVRDSTLSAARIARDLGWTPRHGLREALASLVSSGVA